MPVCSAAVPDARDGFSRHFQTGGIEKRIHRDFCRTVGGCVPRFASGGVSGAPRLFHFAYCLSRLLQRGRLPAVHKGCIPLSVLVFLRFLTQIEQSSSERKLYSQLFIITFSFPFAAAIGMLPDFSPLNALISSVVAETVGFGVYSLKATKENTKGGITYDTAMKGIKEEESEEDEEIKG